jgi:hypothetical protein
VAVSEDVDEAAARRFLTEFPPEFEVPLGRGAMRDRIGYRGLPYTVLLDTGGRVVRRFFGFAGRAQYQMLRSAIEEELKERE